MRKIRYSPDADILTIWLGDERIDHAEEREGVIVHFSEDGRPVLVEILDGAEFVEQVLAAASIGETGEGRSRNWEATERRAQVDN